MGPPLPGGSLVFNVKFNSPHPPLTPSPLSSAVLPMLVSQLCWSCSVRNSSLSATTTPPAWPPLVSTSSLPLCKYAASREDSWLTRSLVSGWSLEELDYFAANLHWLHCTPTCSGSIRLIKQLYQEVLTMSTISSLPCILAMYSQSH